MKNSLKIENWKLKIAPVIAFFVLPFFASAADFTIMLGEPNESGLREGAAVLYSETSVNAIGGKVNVPDGVKIVGITEAQSIIEYWVEKPKWDGTKGEITFGGIIPGGFTGEGVLFHFYAKGDAADALMVDKEATELLANDGAATEEPVIALPSVPLPQEFALSGSADIQPPEVLGFQKATIPGVNNDQPFVMFHLRDDSGIASSQVAYADTPQDFTSTMLEWREAESPLALTENEADKYIYLKAIDREGNEYVSMISPDNAHEKTGAWAFFAILIGGAAATTLLVYAWRRRR
ncbi:MAG: hypothetical protein Q8P49_00795 [Candidatus Liptonbacteria bacterium]|nr:hypothetical protein [Candidatus Liptonbacteria bacterium]